MNGSGDIWSSFTHDPRPPANAVLRASDADRDVVRQVLVEAYADGRLDGDELESRTEAAAAARTLGELPPLVSDLVARVPDAYAAPALVPADELQRRAVASYESDRREALLGFLGPSILCVVIWLLIGGGFFWPGFVIAGTGIHLMRTLVRRQDIIEANRRRLEKKQARELEQERPEGDEDEDR
ncbi:hypothetical protein GCM10009844_38360 [Nocardioides koreensis]|uniref:DUF1707 domain-containing protein n=1 Tax=Nocardioides koreensis TaxID=433651 RepID=A0ABP5LTG8_9ACTN